MAVMPLRPVVPTPPTKALTTGEFLRAIRTNGLTIWPASAYRQDTTVRKLFGRISVLLNAPEAIHHVLVGNPSNYRRSPASIRILRPITGEGLLLSEGDDWKLQRRTVAPALGPRTMPMLSRHIVTATEEAITRLRLEANRPIDLLATMQRLALDIAGRSMFSLEMEQPGEMEQYGSAMRQMLTEFGDKYAQPGLLDMLLPPSIPTLKDFGRSRFRRRWTKLMDGILAARLATPEPETPRDLFDLLRSARDPETGAGFTAGELRDQVATLILAGHETTAVTLFWALIMLAEAPGEQDWLAEEAVGATIDPETAYAMAATLHRTRAVVNEALRLFPAASRIVREAIAADRIGELVLPKRTLVMIAPWVLHRHHALWRWPDVFYPERFMPDQPPPPRFAFMPFGAGPRICVGAQFAMTEAVLVLAALIKQFHVARLDDRPVLPVGIVTTQPDHPAKVRFTLRG